MAATANGNGDRPTRVGIFGWGIVAPRSATVDEFRTNLAAGGSWLEPFEEFGPNNFLVGRPKFDPADYKAWIDERHAPNRYPRLVDKMDPTTLFAVGAFIQALSQNPGLEQELQDLGQAAHVYVGTGLGALPTIFDQSIAYHRAWRRWNYFWAQAERNEALTRFRDSGEPPEGCSAEDVPRDPEEVVRGQGR
ncbi:MAG TPA: beta-ketoacyl synthase N-terminal-like domain-containing protein, partial [Thermoanaerobaculia bacterium]|nr:beta-ketoacyl synthase N-terminal-like domain-containing protein [Thermoanaerobaculia bacterium]